jgi:hypothetical protein
VIDGDGAPIERPRQSGGAYTAMRLRRWLRICNCSKAEQLQIGAGPVGPTAIAKALGTGGASVYRVLEAGR